MYVAPKLARAGTNIPPFHPSHHPHTADASLPDQSSTLAHLEDIMSALGWALETCRHIATGNARPHVCMQREKTKLHMEGSRRERRVVVGHT